MGDMAEVFQAMRAHRRERKARYQAEELQGDLRLLDEFKVRKDIRNHGEHYILTITTDRGARVIDYWPSTGKWKVRGSRAAGYRVPNLLRYFKLGSTTQTEEQIPCS